MTINHIFANHGGGSSWVSHETLQSDSIAPSNAKEINDH